MFVRSWLRAALGAGGTLLVVPVGLVLAVVLAAAVGGSSLSGLGQVFGGPAVPGVAAAQTGVSRAAGVSTADDGVPAIPARARTVRAAPDAAPRRSAPTAPKPSAAPAPTSPSPATSSTPAPATQPPTKKPTPATPATSTPAPAPTTTTAPSAATTPAETNPVRVVGKVVTDTVKPVLPPVTTTVGDAVGSVVDLLAPPP